MVNFGPLPAEIGPVVWGTPAYLTGFASWQRYCSDVAYRKPTKLCTVFGRLLGWYTTYTFSGVLPRYGIFEVQNSVGILQVLRSPILLALLHGT